MARCEQAQYTPQGLKCSYSNPVWLVSVPLSHTGSERLKVSLSYSEIISKLGSCQSGLVRNRITSIKFETRLLLISLTLVELLEEVSIDFMKAVLSKFEFTRWNQILKNLVWPQLWRCCFNLTVTIFWFRLQRFT